MARVVITEHADEDFEHILADIAANGGKAVALKCYSRFEKLFELLALHPESCPLRPMWGKNIRIGIIPLSRHSSIFARTRHRPDPPYS